MAVQEEIPDNLLLVLNCLDYRYTDLSAAVNEKLAGGSTHDSLRVEYAMKESYRTFLAKEQKNCMYCTLVLTRYAGL